MKEALAGVMQEFYDGGVPDVLVLPRRTAELGGVRGGCKALCQRGHVLKRI